MSREILFKAKRLDNGEWVEGDLIRTRDSERILIFSDNIYRCDRNTLCQFTGLTDKNGKRIWENDIVLSESHKYGYSSGTGSVDFYKGSWYVNGNVDDSLHDLSKHAELEVIGTLFDDGDSQYNRNVTYDVTFVGSEEVEE